MLASSSSSSSKRRFDLVDRISPLPDSILRVILSFLGTTEEAVATSILSKRWKCVWMSVPSLDFHFYNRGVPSEFIDFVNHVMHLNTCTSLNKFNLLWNPKYISSSVTNTWINIAITKNVRELSLRCVGPQGPSEYEYDYNFVLLNDSYVIPSCVLCCESLRSLELIGCIISIDYQTVVCLPNLESLTMSPVGFESKQACEFILTGCPFLNFLHLNISHGDFECTISSDTLIHLEFRFERHIECSFNLLKAPALEYLMLKGGDISDISIATSLVSLVEAHFDVKLYRLRNNNAIVQVVRAFHSVKVLTLSDQVLQALAKATISLSTEYKRLVKLVVGTCSSIPDFIYHTKNLQILIIQKGQRSSCFNYQSKRNSLEEVPRCLSNSLKEVRIINYDGRLEDEYEMIRFILQHGSVLETMEISFKETDCLDREDYLDNANRKVKLLQNICMLPRKSPACQFRFPYV